MDDVRWVRLRRYRFLSELQLHESVLSGHGIPYRTRNEYSAALIVGHPANWVELQVPEDHVAFATEILEPDVDAEASEDDDR